MPTDSSELLVQGLLVIHTYMLVIDVHALILSYVPLLRSRGRAGKPSKSGSLLYLENLGVQSHWEDLGEAMGESKGCHGQKNFPLLYLKDAACMP